MDLKCKKFKMYLVSLQVGIRSQKYVSSKKLHIKTVPDKATDSILKYKASINWSVIRNLVSIQLILTFMYTFVKEELE